MTEFDDFMLVIAKPEYYDDCRGFAGVGMPHRRVGGPPRGGIFKLPGLGWLARCLFCETPDTVKSSGAYQLRESPKAILGGTAFFIR